MTWKTTSKALSKWRLGDETRRGVVARKKQSCFSMHGISQLWHIIYKVWHFNNLTLRSQRNIFICWKQNLITIAWFSICLSANQRFLHKKSTNPFMAEPPLAFGFRFVSRYLNWKLLYELFSIQYFPEGPSAWVIFAYFLLMQHAALTGLCGGVQRIIVSLIKQFGYADDHCLLSRQITDIWSSGLGSGI